MFGIVKFVATAGKSRKVSGNVQFGMNADHANIRTGIGIEAEIWNRNRECPGHQITSVFSYP